ncbi:hypothetical protein QJS66_19725 [Kocuria rhizophila]|nr:hypothetical protein QJS66_19725 [Kocuria rhizophila]
MTTASQAAHQGPPTSPGRVGPEQFRQVLQDEYLGFELPTAPPPSARSATRTTWRARRSGRRRPVRQRLTSRSPGTRSSPWPTPPRPPGSPARPSDPAPESAGAGACRGRRGQG